MNDQMVKQVENVIAQYKKVCETDDVVKLKNLIQGEDFKIFNEPQSVVNDFLCKAIDAGAFEVMRYLLTSPEMLVKPDIHDKGEKPLFRSFVQKDLKFVEYLCSSPELTDHSNYVQFTVAGESVSYPFLTACAEGTVDLVRFFLTSPKLKMHVPIEIANMRLSQPETGLYKACQNGRLSIVKYLLTSPDLPEKAKLTKSCVSRACSRGYVDVLRFLCFSPDIKDKVDVREMADSLFQFACQQNNFEMLQFLVEECKLKLTASRDFSSSAFEYAALRADNKMFNYILYDMDYEPTEEEIEKTRLYKNSRGISVKESLEKRQVFRNLQKDLTQDLTPEQSAPKKPKI